MPDPAEFSFEDNEEAGSTESYFFLRYRSRPSLHLERVAGEAIST